MTLSRSERSEIISSSGKICERFSGFFATCIACSLTCSRRLLNDEAGSLSAFAEPAPVKFSWPARLSPQVVSDFYRDGYWLSSTANERLDELARTRGDVIALVDSHRRLSFAEYRESAENLAAEFLRLGLTRDDVIAIQLPNGTD